MTARRYSGSCTVYVELVEEQDLQIPGQPATYRCVVTDRKSGDRYGVMVGHPKHLVRGVDCPQAFDEAAQAALSFAVEDTGSEYLEFHPSHARDLSGYHVGRRPSDANPPP